MKYLHDHGYCDFELIQKEGNYEGHDYSHVWIENELYSIDITSDQFNK